MRLVSIKRSMACRKDVVHVNDKHPSANTGGSERWCGVRGTNGNHVKELRESVCVCRCKSCQKEENRNRRETDFRDLRAEEV